MKTAHVDDGGDCVVYLNGKEIARLGISPDGLLSLALAILERDLSTHMGEMPREQVARLAARMVERWGHGKAF